jgi:hypothetical protein
MQIPVTFADPYELVILSEAIQTQMAASTFGQMKLFQNNYVPTPTSILADFTEATFDGYVHQTFKFGIGPFRNFDGTYGPYSNVSYTMTGSTTPNTIYGCYLVDSTGAFALAIRFPQPIAMVDNLSLIAFALGLGYGQGTIVGELTFY